MADKYHTEWNYRDFATDVCIFMGQACAFKFLGDMAHDLDDAIAMLEGAEHLPAKCLQLELLRRKRFYLEMANGIGNLWETPTERSEWRMRKMTAAFTVATVLLAALAAGLLAWGRVYETVVGCVCCGVIVAMAVLMGWAALVMWREEKR